MTVCHGNGADHCCSLGAAGTCRYLEERTVAGRRWACQLRRQLGAWDRVHADGRYLADVKPALEAAGIAVDCGEWPQRVGALRAAVERGACAPSAACCWGAAWQT